MANDTSKLALLIDAERPYSCQRKPSYLRICDSMP